MMNFRIINQAIINLLGTSAAGRFRVVGYRGQGHDAREVKGNLREVQSYYTQGDFSKSRGRVRGSADHAMVFTVGLTVSAPARCNLAVINREGATKDQIAGALSALKDAAYEADLSMDELTDIVYQILRDPRNYDLGLPVGTVTDAWIDAIRKDDPTPSGELVTLTATMQLSCACSEEVTGDTGLLATGGIVVGLDLVEGDDTVKAGVDVRLAYDGLDGQVLDRDTDAPLYDQDTDAPIIT